MTNIGNNIKRRRIELQMTQEDLAKKMGYKSKSTINKIELGKNDIPQSKIVNFAKALDTTPSYLMGWEQEQKKNDIQTDIVIKMRSNDKFMEAVQCLYSLDDEKLDSIIQLLETFQK